MKKLTQIVTVIALTIGISLAHAAKITPGPKGGRLLENETPRAEFFVETNKTVSITFYDANLKPVAVSEHVVAVTAETKGGKVKIEFEKKAMCWFPKRHCQKATVTTWSCNSDQSLMPNHKTFASSMTLRLVASASDRNMPAFAMSDLYLGAIHR